MEGAVAVLGPLSIDEIEGGPAPGRRLGGTVVYSGLTYRRHGLPARIACTLAAADRGRLAPLAAAGIELHVGRSRSSTRFVNRIEADGRTQRVPARSKPIGVRLARAAIAGAGLVHLGPLLPGDIEPAVLALLEGTDARVALDVQGLVREVDGGVVRARVAPGIEAFLRAAQVVKADEGELETLCAGLRLRPRDLLAKFEIEELVLTFARRGGRIHLASGQTVSYDAVPVDGPADPTGAGDVFLAAYLWARHRDGVGVDTAARHAARVAAKQVAGRWLRASDLASDASGRRSASVLAAGAPDRRSPRHRRLP